MQSALNTSVQPAKKKKKKLWRKTFGRALAQVLTGIAVAGMDVKNDYLSLQKLAKLKLTKL